MEINIAVRGKVACVVGEKPTLVCGNSDYNVVFDFDEAWGGYEQKTALFVYGDTAVRRLFSGNTCEGVAVRNSTLLAIGVMAGGKATTTPATVDCLLSIEDIAQGKLDEPSADVYAQIIALYEDILSKLPRGGAKGSLLSKNSDADFDYVWVETVVSEEQIQYIVSEVVKKAVAVPENLEVGAKAAVIYNDQGKTEAVALNFDSADPDTIPIRDENGNIVLPWEQSAEDINEENPYAVSGKAVYEYIQEHGGGGGNTPSGENYIPLPKEPVDYDVPSVPVLSAGSATDVYYEKVHQNEAMPDTIVMRDGEGEIVLPEQDNSYVDIDNHFAVSGNAVYAFVTGVVGDIEGAISEISAELHNYAQSLITEAQSDGDI